MGSSSEVVRPAVALCFGLSPLFVNPTCVGGKGRMSVPLGNPGSGTGCPSTAPTPPLLDWLGTVGQGGGGEGTNQTAPGQCACGVSRELSVALVPHHVAVLAGGGAGGRGRSGCALSFRLVANLLWLSRLLTHWP